MKAIIISALVSLLVVEVLGGSLYGEKEEVTQEVEGKFTEVQSFLSGVANHIQNEKSKTEENAKTDAINEGAKRKATTEEELKKEITATTRTAIAKGKPLAAIDCIANVQKDGKKLLEETLDSHKKAVDEVLPNKTGRLEFLKLETELISTAMAGLLAEFKEKIKDAKSGFQALKADALKKTTAAKKQLDEIESRIVKPSLFEEYTLTKRKMDAKFKEIKQNLSKRLQQCVA